MDGSRIRNKRVSFSFENGVVWTGSKRIYGLRAFSIQIRAVLWTGGNDTETISVDANLFENGKKHSIVFV